MKAWVLHGAGDLRFENRERPVPREGEVLVKVRAAGICGSDISRVFDTGAHRHPLIPGHEFSGIVEAAGDGTDPAWRNRRVGVFPLIPCGKCAPCRNRQYELCRDYDYLGSRRDGGFAEYVCVPAGNLTVLPEDISYEEAAMLEPLAVAVHAFRRGTGEFTVSKEKKIVICGLGTIGILIAACLTESGYRNLYVVGNKEFQRRQVLALGIAPERYFDGRKKDPVAWLKESAGNTAVFFECTGRPEVFSLAVESTGAAGRVLLVGNPSSDMTLARDVYWKILRNQLTVTGIWNSSFTGEAEDDWHYALRLLEKKTVNPTGLITHYLPLQELRRGLDIIHERKEDYGKIMINP